MPIVTMSRTCKKPHKRKICTKVKGLANKKKWHIQDFYRPQRSCEGYVFTRVSDSLFHGGGGGVCYPSIHCRWYPSMPYSGVVCSQGGVYSWGVLLPGGLLPWGLLREGACSSGECLLQWGVPALGGVPARGVWRPPQKQTATVANSTHPTGMHSCSEGDPRTWKAQRYLPPANEVYGKVMFLHLSVSHSVHSGHRSGRYASY